MKRVYRLYDEVTNSFLPTYYEYEYEVEEARSAIQESILHARVSIWTDYIPDERYTIYSRLHDTSDEWDLVTDADSVSKALDFVTFRLDVLGESYDYRITKTGFPDQVILDVIPGAAYPRLERR